MSREFCRDVPHPWGCSKSLCKKGLCSCFVPYVKLPRRQLPGLQTCMQRLTYKSARLGLAGFETSGDSSLEIPPLKRPFCNDPLFCSRLS